jgi:hypothetical protein
MALERFIPKSPDIFIRNSQDFEVAKFGHLNTIVEYINNNSAKPAGLNGYVQFNNNSALGGDAGLFWDNVNKRLGVGTVTPAYQLTLSNQLYTQKGAYLAIDGATTSSVNNFVGIGTTTPTAILHLVYTYGQVVRNQRVGDSLNGAPTYENFKSGGVPGALTAVLANTNLGQYTWRGSTGATTNGLGARLQVWSLENFTTSAFGSRLDLSVTQLGTTTEVVMMNLRGTGVNIGNTTNDLGARLGIKGSGSTSATTALLVQNSAGTTSLEVSDDNVVKSATSSLSFTNNSVTNAIGNLRILNQTISNAAATAITINSTSAIDLTSSLGARFFAGYLNGAFLATTSGFFVGNEVPNTISARLQVKGAGSTSATSSLLVQNSAGIQGLAVSDDGTAYAGWDTTGGANSYFSANGDVGLGRYGLGLTYIKSTGAVKLQSNNFEFAFGSLYMSNSSLLSSGSAGFGVSPSLARLQIKGSGSTSATTSLLVQNSLATTTFSVNDAGELSLPSTAPKITLGGNLTIANTVSPTRQMVYDVSNGNLSIYSGGVGEGYFIGNRLTNSRTSTAFVTPNALNNLGSSSITAYDNDGNIALQASNNGNRSIVLKGLGASGAVLIGNITTANGTSYSAILQADSTTQGFLPPRMTTAQRTAIASPVNGLIVFDTDLQNLCYRRDGVWVQATFAAV